MFTLPLQLTSFVGREPQIGELLVRLRESRLLTLTGAGGAGKSRLAREVATRARDEHRDGVVLVPLAGVSDPELVPNVVASALGVREVAGRPITDTLVSVLQRKRLLLVLDNCEHLLSACAALADWLLHGCSEVRLLATSRRALGVPGEVGWPVPPLTMPDSPASEPIEEFGNYEAVQLFVDRARAVVPSFTLTPGNAHAVAELCRQLDGLPLAIELAAGRVKVLTPQQIAARLGDRFRPLTTSDRQALLRHQTLRATNDLGLLEICDFQIVEFHDSTDRTARIARRLLDAICEHHDHRGWRWTSK